MKQTRLVVQIPVDVSEGSTCQQNNGENQEAEENQNANKEDAATTREEAVKNAEKENENEEQGSTCQQNNGENQEAEENQNANKEDAFDDHVMDQDDIEIMATDDGLSASGIEEVDSQKQSRKPLSGRKKKGKTNDADKLKDSLTPNDNLPSKRHRKKPRHL
ncbi:uncharacterized protein LOC144641757 [Oculina patagonica]